MVMSTVALPLVTSVKVSGDTSLHLVKAMLMDFLVSSTLRLVGNFRILKDRQSTVSVQSLRPSPPDAGLTCR